MPNSRAGALWVMDWLRTIDYSWTLFLDRDGVINERYPERYVLDVDQFVFLPGVLEAMYRLAPIFERIIVVTNQACIDKGMLTHNELGVIHDHMLNSIGDAQGRVDQVLYSPDLPYPEPNTRKPFPAMALEAQRQYPEIVFEKSIMVGDTQSDIDFGNRLGMKTVWIKNKYEYVKGADFYVPSLLDLALKIEGAVC